MISLYIKFKDNDLVNLGNKYISETNILVGFQLNFLNVLLLV